MSVTRSWVADHLLEVGVAAVSVAGLTLMVAVPHLATVPFHVIWIALAVLVGFRGWGQGRSDAVALGVGLVTSAILGWHAARGTIETEEVAEAPLMTVALLVMITFLRRKQAGLERALRDLEAEYGARERDQAAARRAGHDLRNPLSVARGHAELIRMRSTDPVVLSDSDAVIRAVDTVVDITGRLHDLEAAAERPEPTPL